MHICSKEFKTNNKRTSGIMLMCCGCSRRAVYASMLMDGAESCSYCCDIMVDRLATAPDIVVYDNCCTLARFCLSRYSSFFYKTKWLIDRLHDVNHVNCSDIFKCEAYKGNDTIRNINSVAVEQINAIYQRVEKSLRQMNYYNNLDFQKLFIASLNCPEDRTKWNSARKK